MTAVIRELVPSNRFGAAREDLFWALADVLPGRVYAYAPAPPATPAAPAVWIAGYESFLEGSTLWAAFTVTAVADGADHSAQAMLAEIDAGIFSAATGEPTMRYAGSTPTSIAVSGDVTLRGRDVTVEVATGVHSFTRPVPHTALVPPTVITPNGGP
jgi:hypothetical protein